MSKYARYILESVQKFYTCLALQKNMRAMSLRGNKILIFYIKQSIKIEHINWDIYHDDLYVSFQLRKLILFCVFDMV